MNEEKTKLTTKEERKFAKLKEEKEIINKAKLAIELMLKNEEVPKDLLRAVRITIFRNWNLVKYLAYGYSPYIGMHSDELVSVGMEALPKAIQKYNDKFDVVFATNAGNWIKQYFQSFTRKSSLIASGESKAGKKRNVIFYDGNQDDSNKETYSLVDTVYDNQDEDLEIQSVRKIDLSKRMNYVINSLNNSKKILMLRTLFNIPPTNLNEFYIMLDEENKQKLIEEAEQNNINFDSFAEKQIKQDEVMKISLVKEYIDKYFTNSRGKVKISELSKKLNFKESYLRREKKKLIKELQEKVDKSSLTVLL